MNANLVSLLGDLEGRAKAMPALLQQVLHDTSSLQSHVDTSAQAAREVGLRLQSQTTDLNGKFSSLDALLREEGKRQAGRLADASAGLHALEKLGRQHGVDLQDDRKQTAGLVGKLSTRLGDLSKMLHGDIENERVAINGGLGAIEKAQHRLASTYQKLLGELSNLDTAVNAAAQRTSGAVNQLLGRVQKAAGTADLGRQGFHTAATTQVKSFHEGLQHIHSQTVTPPTLGRTALYVQSVTSLKSSATGSVYSLKSAAEQHDSIANQASTTFTNGYRAHESYSTGQVTSASRKLLSADGNLDNAWKKIPLDSEGNKDNRNFLEKLRDFPGFVAHQAWEFGAWAIKGVSEWVGTHHKEILIALGVVAGVVVGVMLAPVVLPALMAGASAAVGAIGSGLSAGMTMAGSALGGLGSGLAGLGSAVGTGVTSVATSAWGMMSSLGTAASTWTGGVLSSIGSIGGGAAVAGGEGAIITQVGSGMAMTGHIAGAAATGGALAPGLATAGVLGGAEVVASAAVSIPFGTGAAGKVMWDVGLAGVSLGSVVLGASLLASKLPKSEPVPPPADVSSAPSESNSPPDPASSPGADHVITLANGEDVPVWAVYPDYENMGASTSGVGATSPGTGGSFNRNARRVPMCLLCSHIMQPMFPRCECEKKANKTIQNDKVQMVDNPNAHTPSTAGSSNAGQTTSAETGGGGEHGGNQSGSHAGQQAKPAAGTPAGRTPPEKIPVNANGHWSDKLKISQATRDELAKVGGVVKNLLAEETGSAVIGWEAKVAKASLKAGVKVSTRILPGVGWVMDIKDATTGYYYVYSALTGNWDAIPPDDTLVELFAQTAQRIGDAPASRDGQGLPHDK